MGKSMKILNGKSAAYSIKNEAKQHVKDIVTEHNDRIKLVVIQVGNNTASNVYIRNKERACEYVGIISEMFHFDEHVAQEEIIGLIEMLNDDKSVTGILVQLPLPEHLTSEEMELLALQKGVHILGSHRFAMQNEQKSSYIRVSVTSPDTEDDLRKGLMILKNICRDSTVNFIV